MNGSEKPCAAERCTNSARPGGSYCHRCSDELEALRQQRRNYTISIPGEFAGTVWAIDGRVIDPWARARGDYAELEVTGVCLHAWGRTLDIPLRNLPNAVLDFFSAELNGQFEIDARAAEAEYLSGYREPEEL